MKKVLDFIIVIVSLAAATFVFAGFNMEGILLKMNQPETIGSKEIEANPGTVYMGYPAGEGIPEVRSQSEWEETLNDVDYVKVLLSPLRKPMCTAWQNGQILSADGATAQLVNKSRPCGSPR